VARWWEDKRLWIGLAGFGGLVAALQLAGMDPVGNAAFAVTDVFNKGDRLSYGTLNEVTGVVAETPEALRMAASTRMGRDIDANVYALARMLRSEGAKEGNLRVHVALNDLASLGWADAFTLITYSTDGNKKGRYGSQVTRRYASSRDPYEGDVLTAEQAISENDRGFDPAQGATKFVDKSSFGIQAGTGTFDALVQRWAADGLEPFTLPDYGEDLVLFKKA
jgi:hypothetical protein